MATYLMYTDGSFRRPSYGAWATVILQDDKVIQELSGHVFHTTNNRMELMGILQGLAALKKGSCVLIRTDSMYSINCLTKWKFPWKKNGWKSSLGEDIKNRDLIERIDALLATHKSVKMQWVKGHSGDKYNEWCDTAAGALTEAMVLGKIKP